MIAQCKGKDIDNVPASRLIKDGWLATVKYDGNYVQIVKSGTDVTVWTSGGKPYKCEDLDEFFLNSVEDFIIECEYIGNTDGKLGSRGQCTTTTYRVNTEKGIPNPTSGRYKAFDILSYNGKTLTGTYPNRMAFLRNLELPSNIEVVCVYGLDEPFTIEQAKTLASCFIKDGWEGMYIKHISHTQEAGKRVNTAIKIKGRRTADLLCTGVEDGTGKYLGLIGSLELQDKSGRVVNVGSGLNDYQRALSPNEFIGKVIEIEYEQILDTYIQPTFIRVREDKTSEEID